VWQGLSPVFGGGGDAMADGTVQRRAAAALLAVVGGGIALYAGVFALILAVDPIVTWPQRLAALMIGLGIGVAVLAGVRALAGRKVVSWWLALPPAIVAVAFVASGLLGQLLDSGA